MTHPYLQLDGLTKRFGAFAAIDNLTLAARQGSVLALLGPSGSGKTTTLRVLAGFDAPDAGRVLVEGQDVTRQPPAVRRFGMVFQHYALFPHLTVAENVAFGLTASSPAGARRQRVARMLELVDLAGFEDRPVTELSGGQQQRVAVARALAPEPRVLLLDEPLSNLDPGLRERTRRELKQALAEVGITTVLVTHEQEEAFALGDVVAVLNRGRLEQAGPPSELYERPQSRFVATFVGRASVLPGDMLTAERARIADGVEWPVQTTAPLAPGTKVDVVVRPEALQFGDRGLAGTVIERRYTGARAFFMVQVESRVLEVEAPVRAAQVGDTVRVTAREALAFAEATA